MREMEITDAGIVVSRPFQATSGLLTGRAGAATNPAPDGDGAP